MLIWTFDTDEAGQKILFLNEILVLSVKLCIMIYSRCIVVGVFVYNLYGHQLEIVVLSQQVAAPTQQSTADHQQM